MTPVAAVAKPTALYRIYGDADLLLYIGISDDFGRRWKEHAKKQPWWGEMRRLAADEWFDDRKDAEAAEEAAIKTEKPKYNKRFMVPPADPARARSNRRRRSESARADISPCLTMDELFALPVIIDFATACRALHISEAQAYKLLPAGTFPLSPVPHSVRNRLYLLADVLRYLGFDPAVVAGHALAAAHGTPDAPQVAPSPGAPLASVPALFDLLSEAPAGAEAS